MKKLLKWVKPFIFLMIVICVFTIVVPVTYSYVPQFIKYVFDFLQSPLLYKAYGKFRLN